MEMSSNALLAELEKDKEERQTKSVKVVVWDLDNTVWDGVLLEDDSVTLNPGVVDVIKELDRRGILQSISSKNDHATAMAKLRHFGIEEYFLYPQINWGSKAASVQAIATAINVGIDTIAFIDDQPFEREEVACSHPEVLCIDAVELNSILERSEFIPRFITDESKSRRLMYLSDIQRNTVEGEFEGPKEEFLATLDLELTLGRATEKDLQRAEELTKRTHQLNTTGRTYNYDELKAIMASPDHDLLIAGLKDKYGTYGKIGLCLVERGSEYWTVKLLLMSCRVMSRGVGTIIINYLISEAHKAGVSLRAEFIRTDRNRMMYITYRLGNFKNIGEEDGMDILENDCSEVSDYPSYASVRIVDGIRSCQHEVA
ncbi:HAD-IIIC family phosphatase [Oleiagrimonas citrea]